MSTKLNKLIFYNLKAAALLIYLVCAANASIANFDAIQISTINSPQTVQAITFSSYVYIASGSSLTLQGATGYISSSSSVTASAFFGDGNHLAGIAFLNSTQTFTGSDTFLSSFTIRSGGREIILSTSTSTNNIDISSSGVVSFSPQLHNSSSTTIPAYSTTNTSFGPCVTGSTLTITTSGGKVEVIFTGELQNNNGQSGINFLQDGSFVGSLSSTMGIGLWQINPNDYRTTHFSYLVPAPASGAHSYCISLNSGNSANTTSLINDTSAGNIFYVMEIK